MQRWTVNRQMRFEGGFQGRTNKLVDGCYSFWQAGTLPLMHGILCKQGMIYTIFNLCTVGLCCDLTVYLGLVAQLYITICHSYKLKNTITFSKKKHKNFYKIIKVNRNEK